MLTKIETHFQSAQGQPTAFYSIKVTINNRVYGQFWELQPLEELPREKEQALLEEAFSTAMRFFAAHR